MTFNVSNQAPGQISPLDVPTPLAASADDYDTPVVFEAILKKRLLDPLTPGSAVKVTETDVHGVITTRTPSELASIIAEPLEHSAFGSTNHDTPEANSRALELISELSAQTIDSGWPYLRHLFVAQAASELGQPAPGPRVIYTAADDVIPAARDIISKAPHADYAAGTAAWRQLTCGIGATFTPAVLGVGMLTADTFSEFTKYAQSNVSALHSAGKVNDEILKKFTDLAASTLNELTEGFILRREGESTDEYSFARLMHQQVISFAAVTDAQAKADDRLPQAWVMPLDLDQWICPTIVVFANVEHHGRATALAVSREWSRIVATANSPIAMVSTKTLTKLNSAERRLTTHRTMVRAKENARKTQRRDPVENDFSVQAPPPKAAVFDIIRYLEKMEQVNHSENLIRFRKKTLTRANRRRPDDPNVPGRSVAHKFYPDLHIYADTSGSISEGDYRATIMLSAIVAKKLNVNLYFSSHSHVLSNETRIPTKGRTVPQIMEMFGKIPKVSGGNRFEVVYNYIQANPERRRRLNIITTDFGWAPNSLATFTHPKNLVYVPVWDRSNPSGWDAVKDQAITLMTEMRRFDPNIDHKMLGMGYTPPPLT